MSYIDIVFDGPPGHEAPRFVEVEDETGAGIGIGEWLQRDDGYWVLRLSAPEPLIDHSTVKEIIGLTELVEFLWQIIDDIDTISDWAKGNDVAYRRAVEMKQAQRWKTGITTNGYELDLSKAKCPAA